MKLHQMIPFFVLISGVQTDMLHFRKKLLDTFNEARSMLASGQLNPMIDLVNTGVHVFPKFGPAANMHRLKWSRHLEQHAFLFSKDNDIHNKDKTNNFFGQFKTDRMEGLVGFYWAGNIIELAKAVLGVFPVSKIVEILKFILEVIDVLVTVLLLVWKFPGNTLPNENHDIAAANALFAHRYEIGCYGKMFYTVCVMENSTNGNRLYEEGIPCSNCTEYCEFEEHDTGMIEEGNLCEAPKESIANLRATFSPPLTSTIPMKLPEKKKSSFWSGTIFSTSGVLFSVLILIIILLVHVFSK